MSPARPPLQPSLFRQLPGRRGDGPHVQPHRAVKALAAADPVLGAAMARVGRFALAVRPLSHPVETLARSIVSQQLSGRVAEVIFGRLRALLGQITPARILAADVEALRGVGLSYAKVAALRDLAAKSEEGVVPTAAALHRLTDDELVERLTAVRGIGRWTVEMLLMFRLGRPDVLPVDDLGIRKGFQRIHGGAEPPKPKALLAFGERWRPYRTVASWYLWRVLELPES